MLDLPEIPKSVKTTASPQRVKTAPVQEVKHKHKQKKEKTQVLTPDQNINSKLVELITKIESIIPKSETEHESATIPDYETLPKRLASAQKSIEQSHFMKEEIERYSSPETQPSAQESQGEIKEEQIAKKIEEIDRRLLQRKTSQIEKLKEALQALPERQRRLVKAFIEYSADSITDMDRIAEVFTRLCPVFCNELE